MRGGEHTLLPVFPHLCRGVQNCRPALAGLGRGAAVLLAGHILLLKNAQGSEVRIALSMACLVLAAAVSGVLCWLFPLLSRFEYDFGGPSRMAVQFWFAHLPSAAAMAAVLALCTDLTPQLVFPLCCLHCLFALVQSCFVERTFRKHVPESSAGEDG